MADHVQLLNAKILGHKKSRSTSLDINEKFHRNLTETQQVHIQENLTILSSTKPFLGTCNSQDNENLTHGHFKVFSFQLELLYAVPFEQMTKQPSECEVRLGEHISTIKRFDQKSSEFLEKAKMEKIFCKNAFL